MDGDDYGGRNMIGGMFEQGSLPALERMLQFTSARHRVLTNNIANLSTPYFKPADLDPTSFQAALGDAIDQRRQRADPTAGPLDIRDTWDMSFREEGIDATPRPVNENVLFHDQNNRDMERTMQRLAENTLAHKATIDLIRSELDMLRLAIRERIG